MCPDVHEDTHTRVCTHKHRHMGPCTPAHPHVHELTHTYKLKQACKAFPHTLPRVTCTGPREWTATKETRGQEGEGAARPTQLTGRTGAGASQDTPPRLLPRTRTWKEDCGTLCLPLLQKCHQKGWPGAHYMPGALSRCCLSQASQPPLGASSVLPTFRRGRLRPSDWPSPANPQRLSEKEKLSAPASLTERENPLALTAPGV